MATHGAIITVGTTPALMALIRMYMSDQKGVGRLAVSCKDIQEPMKAMLLIWEYAYNLILDEDYARYDSPDLPFFQSIHWANQVQIDSSSSSGEPSIPAEEDFIDELRRHGLLEVRDADWSGDSD